MDGDSHHQAQNSTRKDQKTSPYTYIPSHSKLSLSLRRHAHGLMHMAHLSGNISGVSKSSSDWLNYTGFPGDVVFTTVTTSAYQDQLNAVFSKVCQIFNIQGFIHRSVIVATFPQPKT